MEPETVVPSDDLVAGAQGNLQAYLATQIQIYSTYRTQKEAMTWASATLFVAGCAIVTGGDAFWKTWPSLAFWPLLVLFAATAAARFSFVQIQFKRRRFAAHFFNACLNVSARAVSRAVSDDDLRPVLLFPMFGKPCVQVPRVVLTEFDRVQKELRPSENDQLLTYFMMGLWVLAATARIVCVRFLGG